jgi:tRNA pseudouridine38-40 synthase
MTAGPKEGVRRWKAVCAYDGTTFSGWQSQSGVTAIQDIVEARLGVILKTPTRIHASGRTDAGVHARGQVFHFDAAWPHDPGKLITAFRMGLPEAIQICSLRAVPANFHARFTAIGKRYDYHVHLGDADPFTRPFCWINFKPLDVPAMQAAARVLQGRHDFRAFSALNGAERNDTVRDLRRLEVSRRGRSIHLTAEAEGFLYKMVRSLVGALVSVGEGKLTVGQVRSILHARQRTPAIQTAPPQGLFLTRVDYR